jgi:uncharacterized protein (DUF1499 family)
MTRARAPAGSRRATGLGSSLAWLGVFLAVACGIAELMGGVGYRFGWWTFGSGIQIIRWSATVAAAAAVVAVIAILMALWSGPRRALVIGVIALALSLAAVGPPAMLAYQAKRLPVIHDISTDTVNPPRYVAVLPLRQGATNSTDYSARTAEQQKKGYPDISPAILDVPPAQAMQLAERAALAMGWQIVAIAPEDLRIEATATSWLFHFKDDVVIRITAHDKGSRVDMRSLSRVGRGDFGVNAKRIRTFMERLDSERARR